MFENTQGADDGKKNRCWCNVNAGTGFKADVILFDVTGQADACIHEALHRLLVRSDVELVAILVVVAAIAMNDLALANVPYLLLSAGGVAGVHRKLEVIAIADAPLLIADRADPQRGNALVRVGARLLKFGHRQAATVGRVGHKTRATDALPAVAERISNRPVRALLVRLARLRQVSDRYYRVTAALVDDEVLLALANLFRAIAFGEVIPVEALSALLTLPAQRHRFMDTLLLHPAREKPVLADAPVRLLVAERIGDLARTLATDLVRHSVDQRLALGGIVVPLEVSAPAVLLYARGVDRGTAERLAVVITFARQIDNTTRSAAIQRDDQDEYHKPIHGAFDDSVCDFAERME